MIAKILRMAAVAMALVGGNAAGAQNICNIPISLQVDCEQTGAGANVETLLVSRLNSALTANGMGGESALSSFAMKAELTPVSSENIAGIRPTVAVVATVAVEVCNSVTGEKFAASSFDVRGAGVNMNAAYSAAVRSLRSDNADLKDFLDRARTAIMGYYDGHVEDIIRRARAKSLDGKPEEALWLLSGIPTCCNNYDRVEDCMREVYKTYIDNQGANLLAQARIAWDTGRDADAASKAASLLSEINPASESFPAALDLAREIRESIVADNERDAEREEQMWAFMQQSELSEIELERLRIEACRQIGVAFGENQQPVNIVDK